MNWKSRRPSTRSSSSARRLCACMVPRTNLNSSSEIARRALPRPTSTFGGSWRRIASNSRATCKAISFARSFACRWSDVWRLRLTSFFPTAATRSDGTRAGSSRPRRDGPDVTVTAPLNPQVAAGVVYQRCVPVGWLESLCWCGFPSRSEAYEGGGDGGIRTAARINTLRAAGSIRTPTRTPKESWWHGTSRPSARRPRFGCVPSVLR